MCASVFLNGNAEERGTHLSFYIAVIEGPNDALLPRLFRQVVSLLLINQETEHRNIVGIFRPDITSPAYIRPTGGINMATGLPTLCLLDSIIDNDEFIKDDCMFLGVVINTTNIPQPCHN